MKNVLIALGIIFGLGILGIIGLFVVGAMFAGSVVNEVKNNQEQVEVESKTVYTVGETIERDGKQLTVTKVERGYDTGNQFAQPASGKEFVKVTVELKNNSSRK
jgi:hypothetical protein